MRARVASVNALLGLTAALSDTALQRVPALPIALAASDATTIRHGSTGVATVQAGSTDCPSVVRIRHGSSGLSTLMRHGSVGLAAMIALPEMVKVSAPRVCRPLTGTVTPLAWAAGTASAVVAVGTRATVRARRVRLVLGGVALALDALLRPVDRGELQDDERAQDHRPDLQHNAQADHHEDHQGERNLLLPRTHGDKSTAPAAAAQLISPSKNAMRNGVPATSAPPIVDPAAARHAITARQTLAFWRHGPVNLARQARSSSRRTPVRSGVLTPRLRRSCPRATRAPLWWA